MSIRWLHFSDLHQGMEEQRTLLPAVRQQLFQDIERLAESAGPWDLIVFTGDLTQTGAAAEFDRVTEILERLFRHLERLGSRPFLLAVPGNHDLLRPKPSAVVRALRYFHEDRGIQAEFWRDADNEYRRVIADVFAPYSAWLAAFQRAHPPPPGLEVSLRSGPLPGDFTATVTKHGVRLGIAGLNSAFLQLSGDSYEGRLLVDPHQLAGACGGDAPDWIEQHHINMLMTHHPPEWLHVGAIARFRAEIAPSGWFGAHLFGAHLFGHMHEPTAEFRQMAGAPMEGRIQGASLFGMEGWGDGKLKRIHGYSAGRISVERGKGKLSVWPRSAMMQQDGSRKMVPDHSFNLDHGGAFHVDLPLRGPPLPARTTTAPPPSVHAQAHEPTPPKGRQPLQDPGGPYDPYWYIPPKDASEKDAAEIALSRLRQPGQPVAIWGPELFGKTWLLKHTLRGFRKDAPDNHIVQINLGLIGDEGMSSLGSFLRELATHVAESLGQGPEVIDEAEKRPATPLRRFDWLFRERFLPAVKGALVLAIDQADEIVERPFCDNFFGLLRVWSDDAESEPWSRLRLLLSMSTTPAMMTRSPHQSPVANVASQVQLADLSAAQVKGLADKHGLRAWKEREVEELMGLVGGHPFLVRLVMVNASRNDRAELSALLDEKSPIFDAFLDRMRWRMSRNPALLGAFREIMGNPHRSADPDGFLRLRQAGIVRRVDGMYRIRYPLYERLNTARQRPAGEGRA